MSTSTHPASCRCATCRARRAVSEPPRPGGTPNPISLPLDDPNELSNEVLQAIESDPFAKVLDWKAEDVSDTDIARSLSKAGISDKEITSIMGAANKQWDADRRKRGFRRILIGIGIILITLFVVEGVMWLITGTFGSFGIIDAIGVIVGLVFIVRGIYEVLTAKRSTLVDTSTGD